MFSGAARELDRRRATYVEGMSVLHWLPKDYFQVNGSLVFNQSASSGTKVRLVGNTKAKTGEEGVYV